MIHKHKKILVIEDEIALSVPLKDNLTQEGFDVTVIGDGEEGLNLSFSLKPAWSDAIAIFIQSQ